MMLAASSPRGIRSNRCAFRTARLGANSVLDCTRQTRSVRNLLSQLLSAADSLRKFPERGGLIAKRPGAWFVLVHRYLIVYRIDEHSRTVRVLRFWHRARERMRMRL